MMRCAGAASVMAVPVSSSTDTGAAALTVQQAIPMPILVLSTEAQMRNAAMAGDKMADTGCLSVQCLAQWDVVTLAGCSCLSVSHCALRRTVSQSIGGENAAIVPTGLGCQGKRDGSRGR